MSLRIAVQMDPLESIGISGVSTFAIDAFDGSDTPARIWDAIEAKVAAREARQ